MRVIAPLLIVCLFAVTQAASIQTRTVSGTVVDPAGQAIPGVAIELRKGTSVQRRTTSDSAGAWKFDGVDTGDYVVRFALSGFVTTDLPLKVGETSPAPVRVVLKIGALSETVAVAAPSPGIEARPAAKPSSGAVVAGLPGASEHSGYRLIGYENRILRKEDFNNDRKNAGEMGAGHTVTALYELVPAGGRVPAGDVDPLKYQYQPRDTVVYTPSASNELMTIKLRYKKPDGDTSKLLEFPVRDTAPRMSANLGFAAAVAEFGMLLRRSDFKSGSTWTQAASLAREHRGRDEDGYRAEFIRLVDLAGALDTRSTTTSELRK